MKPKISEMICVVAFQVYLSVCRSVRFKIGGHVKRSTSIFVLERARKLLLTTANIVKRSNEKPKIYRHFKGY